MIETKEQYLKTQASGKWNYYESIPIQNLLSAHNRLPLRNMTKIPAMDVVKKEKNHSFN